MHAMSRHAGDRSLLVVSEKNRGLNQAFQNLQSSSIPQKTVPVGNMLSNFASENMAAGKKGQIASKNLQV
jgi:hypothetical protein